MANRKLRELNKRQKDTLKKHSVHHTQKHMNLMKDLMKKGKSFTQAHNVAMKEVGK
tara:strand:+ start:2540 stop:2707 length:168 start_codon:yes stop_codon:yes gene_type:complete